MQQLYHPLWHNQSVILVQLCGNRAIEVHKIA